MIFYLAALRESTSSARGGPPSKAQAAGSFPACILWPLLMPTIFVLINAVINAFRMVDHVVVMTRGGPDNATTLLLYHLYEVGFKFWDPRLYGRCHQSC